MIEKILLINSDHYFRCACTLRERKLKHEMRLISPYATSLMHYFPCNVAGKKLVKSKRSMTVGRKNGRQEMSKHA